MDPAIVVFLAIVAGVSIVPAWLSGAVVRKHAQRDGEAPSEWIPFAILPYAFARFRHQNKFAIVFAYVFFNLVFLGAIAAFFILRQQAKA